MPHAPGHLRDAFEEWVEARMSPPEVEVGWDGRPRPIRWLLGQLWNCSDIMPSWLCDELGMPAGSTYAQAVRSLWADLDTPSS
jgi:hypothetical protein